jgi:hypothetical protein
MGAIANGDGRLTDPIFIGITTINAEIAENAKHAERDFLGEFCGFCGFCVT